jgi:hypothetical protein
MKRWNTVDMNMHRIGHLKWKRDRVTCKYIGIWTVMEVFHRTTWRWVDNVVHCSFFPRESSTQYTMNRRSEGLDLLKEKSVVHARNWKPEYLSNWSMVCGCILIWKFSFTDKWNIVTVKIDRNEHLKWRAGLLMNTLAFNSPLTKFYRNLLSSSEGETSAGRQMDRNNFIIL